MGPGSKGSGSWNSWVGLRRGERAETLKDSLALGRKIGKNWSGGKTGRIAEEARNEGRRATTMIPCYVGGGGGVENWRTCLKGRWRRRRMRLVGRGRLAKNNVQAHIFFGRGQFVKRNTIQ